jgi:hypothetical protein
LTKRLARQTGGSVASGNGDDKIVWRIH